MPRRVRLRSSDEVGRVETSPSRMPMLVPPVKLLRSRYPALATSCGSMSWLADSLRPSASADSIFLSR